MIFAILYSHHILQVDFMKELLQGYSALPTNIHLRGWATCLYLKIYITIRSSLTKCSNDFNLDSWMVSEDYFHHIIITEYLGNNTKALPRIVYKTEKSCRLDAHSTNKISYRVVNRNKVLEASTLTEDGMMKIHQSHQLLDLSQACKSIEWVNIDPASKIPKYDDPLIKIPCLNFLSMPFSFKAAMALAILGKAFIWNSAGQWANDFCKSSHLSLIWKVLNGTIPPSSIGKKSTGKKQIPFSDGVASHAVLQKIALSGICSLFPCEAKFIECINNIRKKFRAKGETEENQTLIKAETFKFVKGFEFNLGDTYDPNNTSYWSKTSSKFWLSARDTLQGVFPSDRMKCLNDMKVSWNKQTADTSVIAVTDDQKVTFPEEILSGPQSLGISPTRSSPSPINESFKMCSSNLNIIGNEISPLALSFRNSNICDHDSNIVSPDGQQNPNSFIMEIQSLLSLESINSLIDPSQVEQHRIELKELKQSVPQETYQDIISEIITQDHGVPGDINISSSDIKFGTDHNKKLLMPLTPEDNRTVCNMLDEKFPFKTIVLNQSDVVKKESFRRLCPGEWLNDEVIHYYFKMLSARDEQLSNASRNRKRNHFFSSYLMSQLVDGDITKFNYDKVKTWSKKLVPGSNIFKLNKLFFPCNIGQNHWACTVIFMEDKCIKYYDSLGGSGDLYINALWKYLENEASTIDEVERLDVKNWQFTDSDQGIPQQFNGYDCGVFVCMFANFLSIDVSLNFHENQMDFCRRNIALSIITNFLI